MSKFKKGDKVYMVNCPEAIKHGETIWTCKSNSFFVGVREKTEVVFLEGYRGLFKAECLMPDYCLNKSI